MAKVDPKTPQPTTQILIQRLCRLPIGVRQSHLIHTPTTTLHYTHHLFLPHHSLSIIQPPSKTLLSLWICTSASPLALTAAAMASVNSSVLACNYAISGAGAPELNSKLVSMPSAASPAVAGLKLPAIRAQQARVSDSKKWGAGEGRRAALVYLAATLFTTAAATSSANAGVIDDYLEKSKANKVCSRILLFMFLFLFWLLYNYKQYLYWGRIMNRSWTTRKGWLQAEQTLPEHTLFNLEPASSLRTSLAARISPRKKWNPYSQLMSSVFPVVLQWWLYNWFSSVLLVQKVPFLSEDLELECEGRDKYKCGSNVFWKWWRGQSVYLSGKPSTTLQHVSNFPSRIFECFTQLMFSLQFLSVAFFSFYWVLRGYCGMVGVLCPNLVAGLDL